MSSVIKTDGSRRPASGMHPTPFNMLDVEEKANAYLGQIRGQARQIVERAKVQADAVRTQAKQEGRDQALRDAERHVNQQVQQQIGSLLPALQLAVEGIEQVRAECLTHWQKRVVHLAVAIAERVLRRQLAQAPDVNETLIRESLELAAGNTSLTLHLSPQDHQTLSQRAPELATTLGRLAAADLVADPSVSPGGCIVKTKFGQIDQTIEAQLARIEEELAP